MENSKIGWTDHTFSPWWGCAKVAGDPACENCYAEVLSHRWGFKVWGKKKPRRMLSDNHWKGPLRWNRKAASTGVRERVFCASMSDVFEDRRDLDEARERLWRLIEATPSLDWLLLTKRPENFGWLDVSSRHNVWLGVTAVTQEHYDQRIPLLLEHEAAVHFVSAEPLMEKIDLHLDRDKRPTWIIPGGESGHRARPQDDETFLHLVRQCDEFDTACFVKQMGRRPDLKHGKGEDVAEWIPELRVQQFPNPRRVA